MAVVEGGVNDEGVFSKSWERFCEVDKVEIVSTAERRLAVNPGVLHIGIACILIYYKGLPDNKDIYT